MFSVIIASTLTGTPCRSYGYDKRGGVESARYGDRRDEHRDDKPRSDCHFPFSIFVVYFVQDPIEIECT